jgi:hypothetical protein
MHIPVNAFSALAIKHKIIKIIDVLPKLMVSNETKVKIKPIFALKRTGREGSDSPSPNATLSFLFTIVFMLKGFPRAEV